MARMALSSDQQSLHKAKVRAARPGGWALAVCGTSGASVSQIGISAPVSVTSGRQSGG
jgi:hypothetical protein